MTAAVHHPAVSDHCIALCRILGLDPIFVRELKISAVEPLVATLYKRTPSGEKYVDPDTGSLALETKTFEIRA